tara:strand:+ start:1418 stop:2404 length:987 start_codon:yes stop_codon:yes gene_type:complete
MIIKSYLVEENINLLDKNLVLFYGENLGLKNQIKEIIKLKTNAEILNLFQDEILKKPEVLFNEILNKSLFENEKNFFINEVDDKILPIIEEIKEKQDSQKIYLFSNILDKKSKIRSSFEKSHNSIVVPCYADNEITLKKLLINKLKDYKGVSPSNINIILESCNNDRDKLNNEISKIKSYFINKEINSDQLEDLLNLKVNESFAELNDHALDGNKIKVNQLLSNTTLEPEKSIMYLSIVNQRVLKISKIVELKNTSSIDEIINKFRPPIFWKEKPKITSQCKKWNLHKIKNILNKIYNLELKIKSSSDVKHNLLIKKLMIDICNLASI